MKKLIFFLLFLGLTFNSYAAETQAQNILTGEDYKEDSVSLNEELRKLHKSIKNVTDTDIKSKVSSNDTTAGYLNGKLVAGTGITLTENTDGGNETLGISLTGTTYSHKQLFTANGTFTAPAGVTSVWLTLVGGGGGGKGHTGGGGGGGGATIIKRKYTVTPSAEYAVVIGAGGAGGTAVGGNGGNGVDSSFDTLLTVAGGTGATSGSGGVGGVGSLTGISSGTAPLGGGNAHTGFTGGTGGAGSGSSGGGGGGTYVGYGGLGGVIPTAGAVGYAGGGGGGGTTDKVGGAGGDGFVLVEY